MIDAVSAALQTADLSWVLFGAFLAGLVRGFAGFGTAMIYLPFALVVFDKPTAMFSLVVMDLIGPLPFIPQLWKDSKKPELGKLILGMALVVPFAIIFVFETVEKEHLRFIVSIVSLVLVVLLMLGVRYRGVLKDWMLYGVGGLGGLLGGIAGVPGPPVIMFYMASTSPPKVIRANNSLFLVCFDWIVAIIFFLRGLVTFNVMILGLIVTLPYQFGLLIGARIFHPSYEKTYRRVAYAIIGASAISGLPLFS